MFVLKMERLYLRVRWAVCVYAYDRMFVLGLKTTLFQTGFNLTPTYLVFQLIAAVLFKLFDNGDQVVQRLSWTVEGQARTMSSLASSRWMTSHR